MNAVRETRNTMGENMIAAATWATEGLMRSVSSGPQHIYSILGDQRNSFNLTGETVAPATCHDTGAKTAD